MTNDLISSYVQTKLGIDVTAFQTIFLILATYYTNFRILNKKINTSNIKSISKLLCVVIISLICGLIRYKISYSINIICSIILLGIIFLKDNIVKGILTTLVSFGINYVIRVLAISICFVFNSITLINNDYVNLAIMLVIHVILLYTFFKIKRFKFGLSFLKNNIKNEYMDIFILNICVLLLFLIVNIVNSNIEEARQATVGIIVFSIIMFITIQKSLQLYYKQKLLIQDLNETKEELEKKKQEIEQLEKENLSFSKKSHSLAHKQKALEYQINTLLNKIAEEVDIKQNTETNIDNKTKKEKANFEELTKVKDKINKLSKEVYNKTATVELSKTGIFEIDNILEYMQSESNKNDIDFNLQITGNIYHMINNIIDKEDLQILLADHIKNAIIAIKHANNINKSILVKLGKIENIYSLYIYDSGIEFEKETLMNLGKKPSTTHAKDGGTGMGFMNTFDTLKKYNASLIINEIGKTSKDNYTKVLIIKFDNKCEFKIISYRQKEIGEISEKLIDKSTISDIIVENKT